MGWNRVTNRVTVLSREKTDVSRREGNKWQNDWMADRYIERM